MELTLFKGYLRCQRAENKSGIHIQEKEEHRPLPEKDRAATSFVLSPRSQEITLEAATKRLFPRRRQPASLSGRKIIFVFRVKKSSRQKDNPLSSVPWKIKAKEFYFTDTCYLGYRFDCVHSPSAPIVKSIVLLSGSMM